MNPHGGWGKSPTCRAEILVSSRAAAIIPAPGAGLAAGLYVEATSKPQTTTTQAIVQQALMEPHIGTCNVKRRVGSPMTWVRCPDAAWPGGR